MLIVFFFIHFLYAEENHDSATETTNNSNVETHSSRPSPYYACSGPRINLTGQARTSWISRRVPTKDHFGNQTKDFFIELQTRIQARAQSNLDLTNNIIRCFRIPKAEAGTQDCQETRSWINPTQFPTSASNPQESLAYQIRLARMHLALADSNPGLYDSMTPNTSLETYGFKTIPWNSLSATETQGAQDYLNQYKENFKSIHHLTEQQFQSLLKPYDRSALEGQVYANPMNVSDLENRHRILQSELNRQFTRVRNQHLNVYRGILSQYPILNYLSSDNPSVTEVVTAANRIKSNAEKELNIIKQQGEYLKNFTGQRFTNDTLNLLDYESIVEEVLMDRPEFCAVATTAQATRDKRDLKGALIVAPLLAVCFLAPPLTGAVIGVGMGTAFAISSYTDYKSQQQAAYAAPLNDGSLKADQYTVDASRTRLFKNLAMIPVSGIGVGTAGQLRRMLPVKKGP